MSRITLCCKQKLFSAWSGIDYVYDLHCYLGSPGKITFIHIAELVYIQPSVCVVL